MPTEVLDTSQGQIDAFLRGLSEIGYADGKNVILERRFADGKLDRLPALVTELLAQKIDLVFAPSGVAAQAAKKSGTTIPIVFAQAQRIESTRSTLTCRSGLQEADAQCGVQRRGRAQRERVHWNT